MATSTIKPPITAPYSSAVHEACWKAWDAYRTLNNLPDQLATRKLFMDGWIQGVNA